MICFLLIRLLRKKGKFMKKSTIGIISLITGALILGAVCITVPAVNNWFKDQGDSLSQQLDGSSSTIEPEHTDSSTSSSSEKKGYTSKHTLNFFYAEYRNDNSAYSVSDVGVLFNDERINGGSRFIEQTNSSCTYIYIFNANRGEDEFIGSILKVGSTSGSGSFSTKLVDGCSFYRLNLTICNSSFTALSTYNGNTLLTINGQTQHVASNSRVGEFDMEFNFSSPQTTFELSVSNAVSLYISDFQFSDYRS